ncbi:MAG: MaoC family dehydratase [Dehalococcoidales bacterium]|nr:MaoC family dehydratase [Dehalococcoidales bacterium]
MPAPFELKEGASLPGLKKDIVQENINLYAKASGDFNPIHIDADYARKTPLGGTVAHGMLILAYVSQMMTGAFERDWLSGGRLNVRFRAPARPGDVITISGSIRHVEKSDGYQVIDCDILCSNQNNEPVITGDARIKTGDK